ncbi:lipid-A-disaccharide synthase [Sulfurimonas lithotrophica]|uniref:Lipid-A-disaccharide synthase n=1 Tax=Sulfurimonas lithotrophica TaxID=2590022 RepID=A0A5P8P0A2_9BACT|nr:lipid-A-disaccharide synthase [Sulfurimonas lithotrophica]QFR49145.1 lipid-A-disaccharide synthase [Sulfurimonas lithotrophica]
MKILVSALEHSANVHLKSLKKELADDVEFVGIFSNELGNPIVDLSALAIMGIVDALKKLRFFFKLKDEMVELAKDVDKVLLIDSSGFNLPLAKALKKRYPNKEIIYYILPQAWAWKKKRIPVLARTIDTLASILPFEPSYYPSDANITYVGHPLLDQITEFKTSLNDKVKKIVFMPGSRKGEITRLMPIFREVREKLGVKGILIIPTNFSQEKIDALYGDISKFEVVHETYNTLLDADFAFICSGTATLEASIIGTPLVLSYIANKIDWFIVSRLATTKYAGLANIMYDKHKGKTMHPEFLQDAVTAQNLIDAFNNYNRDSFLKDSKELRAYLQHGSSKNVADLITK